MLLLLNHSGLKVSSCAALEHPISCPYRAIHPHVSYLVNRSRISLVYTSAAAFTSTPYRKLLKQQYLRSLFLDFERTLSPFFRTHTKAFFAREGSATMTDLFREVSETFENDPSFMQGIAGVSWRLLEH